VPRISYKAIAILTKVVADESHQLIKIENPRKLIAFTIRYVKSHMQTHSIL
jgi:hypothetical protein